jgi:malonyl-ACP decarboxylase
MASGSRVVVTGMGVLTSHAAGVPAFSRALRDGRTGIAPTSSGALRAAARVAPAVVDSQLEALLDTLAARRGSLTRIFRNTSRTARVSLLPAFEACRAAGLAGSVAPDAIGLVVAGSNLAQGYMLDNAIRYGEEPEYINPRYGLSFWDTNLVGCLSEALEVRGVGYTVGGASAAGNAGLLSAVDLLRAGRVAACLVVGALAEFSELEIQGLVMLGALLENGTFPPESACRPFDTDHAGFVLGEGAACVVLEREDDARRRGARVAGEIGGVAIRLDGQHLPTPSAKGEADAMRYALKDAGIGPAEVSYVNAHGTAAPLGDRTECQALREVFGPHLGQIQVNATKALTGHCMGASSIIEIVATLIQQTAGFLHPNPNLERSIDDAIDFVGRDAQPARPGWAVSNAFGFGGINTSVVLRALDAGAIA